MIDGKQESITLIQPRLSMQEEYYRYCQAYHDAGEPGDYWDKLAYEDFSKFIKKLEENEKGIDLVPGYVPSSTYWLVRNDHTILGSSSLRHFLTPDLEDLGGHIGYRINPLERRKGYGTLILQLTMEKARERGLTRVLVTCDPTNTGSAKIIQNNGGVLVSESFSEKHARAVSRYWIQL